MTYSFLEEALRESVRDPVNKILRKYNMDTTYLCTYDSKSMFDEIWYMRDASIQNQKEITEIRAKERDRAETVNKAMRNIELEMALGGNKEKFMEMLEQVVIE